jgi:hypothetical protein
MITFKGSMTFHTMMVVVLCFISCSASAQSGVPFQLREVQEQLIRVEAGVNVLEKTVNEIVLVERARCDRPVSWNRKLPGNERFALALNGHAFCDLETGLVWTETPISDTITWTVAGDDCRLLEIDGRRGWHLPTVEELLSLIDQRNAFPALPLGHPFKGLVSDVHWTSSPGEDSVYGQLRKVWVVDMGTGTSFAREVFDPPFPSGYAWAWCVRGGVSPSPISDVNLEGAEIDPYPD